MRTSTVLSNLILALVYIALAWLVSLFHMLPAPLWPSTGLAAFAALAGGWRWMPGIALGSWLANNLLLGWSTEGALWVTAGNVLGPMLGATLLQRMIGRADLCFDHARGVAGFFIFLGLFNGAISALFGASGTLHIMGVTDISFEKAFIQWAIGDAASTILLAPAIFLWWKHPRLGHLRDTWAETLIVGAILLLITAVTFFQPPDTASVQYGATALILLPLTWAALRLPRRDAYTLLALVFLIMLTATLFGYGPFVQPDVEQPLANLQLRISLLGTFVLLAGSLDHERRQAIQALADLNRDLERRVMDRTSDLEAGQDRLRKILETLPTPLAIVRPDLATVVEANATAASAFGYRPKELVNADTRSFYVDLQDRERLLSDLDTHGIVRGRELRFRHREGHTLWLLISIAIMQDADHPVALVAFQDITSAKSREHELARLATTDALTGTANRRHFMDQAEQALETCLAHKQPLAMLILDLDLFKLINDRHGHLSGDKVLRMVSSALQGTLRHKDLIGRLGGEEFGVLLPDTDARGARDLAERLRIAIENLIVPVDHDTDVRLTISIGGSLLPAATATVTPLVKLIAEADRALYAAKDNGRNQVVLWPVE